MPFGDTPLASAILTAHSSEAAFLSNIFPTIRPATSFCRKAEAVFSYAEPSKIFVSLGRREISWCDRFESAGFTVHSALDKSLLLASSASELVESSFSVKAA